MSAEASSPADLEVSSKVSSNIGSNVGAPPIELVLFDCDGTLVDSEFIAAQAWSQVLAQSGVTLSAEEAFIRFKGGRLSDCVSLVEAGYGVTLPASFVADLRGLQSDLLADQLQPIAGALELVRELDLPFCLASNGPPEKIRLCLAITGLLPYFEGRIFSGYDVGSWKPDPALFLHAARAMGVAPHHCAVVEDSLPGIQAGLAAGMTVFALDDVACAQRNPAPDPDPDPDPGKQAATSISVFPDLPEGVHRMAGLHELRPRLAALRAGAGVHPRGGQ